MTATISGGFGGRASAGVLAAAIAVVAVVALWQGVPGSDDGRTQTAAVAAGEDAPGDVVGYESVEPYAAGPDPAYANVQADVIETAIRPWGEQRGDVFAGAFTSGNVVYVGFTARHEELLAEVRAFADLPADEIVAFRAARPLDRYNAVIDDLAANADRYAQQGAPVRLAVFEAPLQTVRVAMVGEFRTADERFARLLELVDYDEVLTAIPQGSTPASATG